MQNSSCGSGSCTMTLSVAATRSMHLLSASGAPAPHVSGTAEEFLCVRHRDVGTVRTVVVGGGLNQIEIAAAAGHAEERTRPRLSQAAHDGVGESGHSRSGYRYHGAAVDTHQDLRAAVRELCASFPDAYWRDSLALTGGLQTVSGASAIGRALSHLPPGSNLRIAPAIALRSQVLTSTTSQMCCSVQLPTT